MLPDDGWRSGRRLGGRGHTPSKPQKSITWLRLPKPSVFQRNPRRPAWTNCRSEFLPRARSPFARGAPATPFAPAFSLSGSPLARSASRPPAARSYQAWRRRLSGDEGDRGDRHGSQWIRGLGAEGSEAGEERERRRQPPATSTFHASANAAMSPRARTNATIGPTTPVRLATPPAPDETDPRATQGRMGRERGMQGTQLDGSCGPCRAGWRDSPDGGAVGLGDPSLDRADGGSQRQSPAGAVRSRANGCLSPDGGARGRRTNRTCAMSPGTGSASAGDSAGASDGRPLGPGHGRIAGAQRPPRGVRMGGDRARATAWTRGRSFGARRSDGRGNAPEAAGQLKDRRVADRPAAAASARPRVLEREAVAVAVEV